MTLSDNLISAAERGDTVLLDKLIKPSIDAIQADLDRAASQVASKLKHGAVELLLAKGASKGSALRGYAQAGDLQHLQIYFAQGVDVNEPSSSGQTALILAARYDHLEVVKALLDKGADVHATNEDENTALHLAAREGHKEIVTLLVARGAKIDEINAAGETALWNAVSKNRNASVRILLENGAQINIKDDTHDSAFIKANRKGFNILVKLLLQYGADIDERNADDETVLMMAAMNGNAIIAETLLNNGAKIDEHDMDGDTALTLAALEGHHAVVNVILKYILTVNRHSLCADFLQREVDKLVKMNDLSEYQTFTLLRNSLHLYHLMKHKNFGAAKKWLVNQEKLFFHFSLEPEGSLYHLLIQHWSRNPELITGILKLLTGKHKANPYLPNKNGELTFEIWQRDYGYLPDYLFAHIDHVQLHQLFNSDVIALLHKVFVSRFLPIDHLQICQGNTDGQMVQLSPRQQIQLLQEEISKVIQSIRAQDGAQPHKLLAKLQCLQASRLEDPGFRIQLFPMKLTLNEHDNLKTIILNLQKFNRIQGDCDNKQEYASSSPAYSF